MTIRVLRPWRREHGSLPLALLASIIVAGIVVVLVVRIVATQNQVRFDQGYHASLPVADAGTNLGKFWLNNDNELQATGADAACDDALYKPGDYPVGCSTPPETRTIEGDEYTFTLTKIADQEWEISSIGEDAASGERRQAVATIRERPLVDVALFSDFLINFSGSNAADSYTSDPSVATGDSWCTGRGFIATNGDLDLSGTSGGPCHTLNRTIDRGHLHDTDGYPITNATETYPGGDRCEHAGGGGGANCRTVSEDSPEYLEPEIFEEPLDLASESKVAFIDHALKACDDAGVTVPGTMRTSDLTPSGELQQGTFDPDKSALDQPFEFPGEVDGPFHCADSLYFDVSTSINATSDDPVIIVVRDTVTIKGQAGPGPEAHVGCGGGLCVAGDPSGAGASRPDAARLWIFTNGDITFGNHSAFAGVMWGPGGECDGDAQAEIFGSLICGSLPHNLGGWRFHYDDALAQVSSGEFYTSTWREEFIP